jgi:hypothetical protein
LVQGLIHGFNIISKERKNLAIAGFVKIFKRQTIDFGKNISSEFIGYLHRNTGHNKALDIRKQSGDDVESKEQK